MKKYLTLLFLLINVSVFSQQADSTYSDSTSISPITITAIRGSNYMPITYTTLDRLNIQKTYFGQEMPIILSRTPSIQYNSDGGNFSGYSYMRLRGMEQTRINFTLNGVPLNDPLDQNIYFCNYADFGNSVQSVQVQRGVGTSTNGTSSYAGAVSFESLNPFIQKASSNIQLSSGSYSSHRMSGSVNSGLNNGVAYSARYSYNESDGYRYHSGNKSHSLFITGGKTDGNRYIKGTFMQGLAKNQMAWLPVSLDQIRQDPRTNVHSPDETDDFGQTFMQLQTGNTRGKWKNDNSIHYVRVAGHYGYALPDTSMLDFAVESNLFGFHSTFRYETTNTTFNTGISSYWVGRKNSMSMTPYFNNKFYTNQVDKTDVNLFINMTHKIGKLALYGDIQIRRVNMTYRPDDLTLYYNVKPVNWIFVNPKAGLTWTQKNKTFYTSIAYARREPARSDLLLGADNIDNTNYSEIGKLNSVKPEQIIDYEMGMRYKMVKGYMNLNAYMMNFKNEIVPIEQFTQTGLQMRKNVDRSYRAGVEAEYSYLIMKNLTINGFISYQQSRIEKYVKNDSTIYYNTTHLLSPKWITNTGLTWSPKKFTIGADFRYVSDSYLANDNNRNTMIPSYTILNSNIGYSNDKYSITFMLQNITNRLYYTAGLAMGGSASYYVQALRNFFITIKIKL